MPVSVVIGGQFGSEGKGKVAHEIARARPVPVAVRVGGSNSGHTVVDSSGSSHVFRHLPTPCLLPHVVCVIGPGAYIDANVLLGEIHHVGLGPDRLLIDPSAVLITGDHKQEERQTGLRRDIGSTLSGVGAAVAARIRRSETLQFVGGDPRLEPFVRPTRPFLREALNRYQRVLIEGTQGYGLSLLSENYPYVTSRNSTAAGFVAEAGLSPRDVDHVIMVIRAFPVRVAGNSGPLPNEIDWETITREGGHKVPLLEHTTVTKKVRRVARFDPEIVKAAIEANAPSRIVLNHVDYVDHVYSQTGELSEKGRKFQLDVARRIGAAIDYVGLGSSAFEATSITARRLIGVIMSDLLGDLNKFAEDDAQAEARADKFRLLDPFPEIESSLLNRADVFDYVRVTGMLFPFDEDEDKRKTASYEADIKGECIYWDEDGKKHVKILEKPDSELVLGPNSIAFVQVEPLFRLPVYIALRFNLKITHVHRGLLLGTGPLVDPGYLGKLMIPLHNLTTNTYIFTCGEPLIWIEFTKLSPNHAWERRKDLSEYAIERRGEVNKEDPFPRRKLNLTPSDMLAKASPHSPIRSSIPDAIQKAESASVAAKKDAEAIKSKFDKFRVYAGLGFALTVATIIYQGYQLVANVKDQHSSLRSEFSAFKAKSKEDRDYIENFGPKGQMLSVFEKMRDLEDELMSLRAEMEIHKGEGIDDNVPGIK